METDCLGLPILYNRLGMVASLINSIYDLQLSSFFFSFMRHIWVINQSFMDENTQKTEFLIVEIYIDLE